MADDEQVAEVKRTWEDDDYHVVVMQRTLSGLGNFYTAYVGIPEDHVAAGLSYDDVPVDVHGGLTYGRDELAEVDEDGEKPVKWFGWDYNHATDHKREVEVEEPVEDAEDVVDQFKEMTAKTIVDHKIRFLPDEVLEKVDISEADNHD